MYPNSEAIGTVFNQEDVLLAQLAFEISQTTTRADTLPPQLAAKELELPAPNEEGCVVLDLKTTNIVLNAAKIACSAASLRHGEANNLYVNRRADHAEVEELQFLAMGIASAREDAEHLRTLYQNTEACLLESESMIIDKGLSRQTTDI